MEKMKVRDLMKLIDEFPRISSRATFSETVEALEKSEKECLAGHAHQKILLVNDETGKVLGKVSPMDVLQGLEPDYESFDALKTMPRYRTPASTLEFMKESLRFWQKPLAELCSTATDLKIDNFIKTPTPDHTVKADDRMDTALHLFVVGRHDSLFVQEGKQIVGVLLFSDVYRKIVQTMRECRLPE
jgi:CBS domain-containing protein